jgi:hypothetical protein
MHLFQMFGQQPFGTIATMQVSILYFHFDLTFVHFLSFRAILGGQGGIDG